MTNKLFAIALGGILALGANAALNAQDQAPAQAPAQAAKASNRANGGRATGA